MSAPLRSSRSALNPRVTLITADRAPSPPPLIKAEPISPSNKKPSTVSPHFTSLRRTTRSLANPTATRLSESTIEEPTNNHRKRLDVSKYEYTPTTPSPRKKPRLDITPIAVKRENGIAGPSTPSGSAASPRTPKSASKKPFPQLALDKPHPAPARWEEQYRLIERMRKGIIAPVDNMGCERPRTIVNDDPKTLRFHILISLMLSSQTKDPVTSQAVSNLHDTLPGGLTAQSLADASLDTVYGCINKVGFWRRKADYIQEAARTLLARPGEEKGDVPKTLEGLCDLKGVGPKMAFLALQCAWDINAGIGVDVHVHRITNRLKWHKPPTTTPEQTRLNLQSWLPPQLHKPINPMLVGFGQMICLPVGPRCDICLLGQKKICPSRVANVKSEGRKEVLYTFKTKDGDDEDGMTPSAKVEIGYEAGAVPPIDAEAGLVRMKEDPEPGHTSVLSHGIKMERDEVGIDGLVQEPGMKKVDEVLEILDEVDGARGIDGERIRERTVKQED
ncbi:endonuclease III [Kwoniella heveanensis BCC8398]|uniref:Endonuclease III homolog n=1 Tax=Kwoniella heveanensis BCC8398 TaxID=1296120 RepID=A0A1B9GSP2_9TREE|nr:endonuclease III [Kwoniella heveanensis BCC8398]